MARERNTEEFDSQKRSDIVIPNSGGIDNSLRGGVIESAGLASEDYLKDLSFAEDAIQIRIERSSEKHAPKVREVWVNGKGAEQYINDQWITCGWLPVGVPVTTKRKYAEVLARSKVETISTETIEVDGEKRNVLHRRDSAVAPFTVLRDGNPRGAEWLNRLMWEQ